MISHHLCNLVPALRHVSAATWQAVIGQPPPRVSKWDPHDTLAGLLGNKVLSLDDVTSKVVLYRNMRLNKSEEYRKTFIGFSIGLLQGVEFGVEPQEDHTFEVEPHGNVSLEKIYAYESLTFNDTVGYEVFSKRKAGLKEVTDDRSDMYVLSNGCRKSSDNSDGYYLEYTLAKGNVLGMEIVRDQSGNTLRVSRSKVYNGKLVQTLLEGYSILSLEGSLSGSVM
ncbi:hypothetical protein Tco_1315558 [Tanacetum coccineum]